MPDLVRSLRISRQIILSKWHSLDEMIPNALGFEMDGLGYV